LAWVSSPYQGELEQGGAQYAVDAGATWDRWPFERGIIPKIDDAFVFDHGSITYSGAIARDEAHDLNTLAIINGPAPLPLNLDDWRAYVEAIVTQYGDQVDAWEIGNEWGLPHQNGLDADDYVAILRTTCEVLYEHGQGSRPILLGSPELGISLYSDSRWNIVLQSIQEDKIDKNYGHLPDCLNAVGVHVYGRPIFSHAAIERNYDRAGWNPGVWITEHGVMWQDETLDEHPFANKYRQASYVVQQYILALAGYEAAGIDPLDFDRAKIFYHRFADSCPTCPNPDSPKDRYWGLMDYDRDPRYPSYDAMSLVTSLFGGASAPEDMNPNSHKQESVRHYRFEKGGQYTHVLWTANEAVTGWSFPAEGTDPGRCATLYYQPGDGVGTGSVPSESGNDGRFWKTSIGLEPSGEFLLDLPASAETDTGNDEFSPLPMIGGPTYILVETNEPCKATPPEGEAAVICRNGRAVGTDLQGYDADSGLASLSYACSPEKTYDLSWTEPGRTYAGPVYIAPPEDTACTLTLTDERASESASERIGESAISRSAVLLYRHVILVYADGEPGYSLFIVHLVIVNCPPAIRSLPDSLL
jgi:hypothetical protein